MGSKLSEYMERAQIKRGGNAVLGILYKFVFTLFFFYYFVYLFTHKVWPFFLFLFCCFSFFIGILRLGSAANSPVRLQVCVQLCVCVCVCVRTEIAISICSFLLFFIFVESKTPPHVVPPSPAPAATNWKL